MLALLFRIEHLCRIQTKEYLDDEDANPEDKNLGKPAKERTDPCLLLGGFGDCLFDHLLDNFRSSIGGNYIFRQGLRVHFFKTQCNRMAKHNAMDPKIWGPWGWS